MNGCRCNLIILTIVYFVCGCCVFIFSWRYMFLYNHTRALCYHTAMHPSPSPYGTKPGGSCSIGQIRPHHSSFYLTIVRLDGCSIEVLSLIIAFFAASCSTFELRVHDCVVTLEPLVLPFCAARQPLAYMVVDLTTMLKVYLAASKVYRLLSF
jgi:hypothetical protein